ncbi:GPI mannosyltransferase 2 [Penicillium taxi]|uniref:GPI mannosyltransferase 2 n=1 Tax=Penicillium taxi TaxID=168475 RepID=UPI002545A9F5|nr:GPI mannosyltransferase 2 [Penicillium taxi]KAJ5899190.1 GPI mannosyltransferase 2 [Penicillium taxi]
MSSIGPRFAKLLQLDNPIGSLTAAFWLWKALLFIVVAACPGPGYDTSTSLVLDAGHDGSLPMSLKFARWDSIYFLHTSEQGYVFEQEWAFSWPRLLSFFVSGRDDLISLGDTCLVIRWSGGEDGTVTTVVVGVAVSHFAHYLSVLALYGLSGNIFGDETVTQRLICFLSATLHIITPAGAFLSAPYGESTFSFLNFSGFYFYSSSLIAERKRIPALRDFNVLVASVFFAIATLVRSNGILSGFLFAYDAVLLAWETLTQGPSVHTLRRLGVVVLGGCIVALGMIVPQISAYHIYCTGMEARPWCSWTVPSIYTFVQGFYWNVGFLRYWTISNLPLFLLAAPVLAILCKSSLWALKAPVTLSSASGGLSQSSLSPGSMLFRLAIPQLLLAIMALTSYHVQIINRISSGYPLWYWFLVSGAMVNLQDPRKRHRSLAVAAQAMVVYALIQGVLFGSFLPPA